MDFPDTRVIELVGHVQEKSSSSIEIHIDSFANKEVVQEIPIPNKTSQDWLVKVNFEPALSSITSHSSMVVKANQSAYLPLCIRPRTEEIGRTLMTSLVLECPGYFQQRFSIQVKVDQ